MTQAQLLAKKPRVELTLKQKSDMIDEAQKRGFNSDHVERTLCRVNQTKLAKDFNVNQKTVNRTLKNAKAIKQQLLSLPGD